MTGFHIRIGYISGYSCSLSKETAFKYLLVAVNNIRANPLIIAPLPYLPWTDQHKQVAEMNYKSDGPGLKVLEDEIMLLCSGFDEWRRIKEQTAYYASMYIINYAASLGIPVSLDIA